MGKFFALVFAGAIWKRRGRQKAARAAASTAAEVVEQRELLDATLAFAEAQILAQVADEAGIDSRTIGILGLNGVLLGGTLAAKTLLGSYWWTPLPVAGVATVPCLWSVFKKTSAFGPLARDFYERFAARGPLAARAQLLADLDDTFKFNAKRVKWKTRRLRISVASLVVGLSSAALLIALDRPTTIKTCQTRIQHQSQCLPRQTSRSSVQAGSSAAARALTEP